MLFARTLTYMTWDIFAYSFIFREVVYRVVVIWEQINLTGFLFSTNTWNHHGNLQETANSCKSPIPSFLWLWFVLGLSVKSNPKPPLTLICSKFVSNSNIKVNCLQTSLHFTFYSVPSRGCNKQLAFLAPYICISRWSLTALLMVMTPCVGNSEINYTYLYMVHKKHLFEPEEADKLEYKLTNTAGWGYWMSIPLFEVQR